LRWSIQRERSTKRKIVESGNRTVTAIMKRTAEDILMSQTDPFDCPIVPRIPPNSKCDHPLIAFIYFVGAADGWQYRFEKSLIKSDTLE
jgi:hypothetical protein